MKSYEMCIHNVVLPKEFMVQNAVNTFPLFAWEPRANMVKFSGYEPRIEHRTVQI
jgi:hypothetical protein